LAPAKVTDSRLDGRVAVVTGAAGRLGHVWIDALTGAGATAVGLDVVEGTGGSVGRIEIADITDREALSAAADRIEGDLGPVDVLVNNAGIDQPPDAATRTFAIEDVPLDDFRETVDVNLLGTFNATQVFGARMRDRGGGSIVNIGSVYASSAADPRLYDHMEVDPPFLKPAAYGASKAGVVNLTRYFARLWGPAGVRVNALSPGGVAGGQDPEFVRKYSERVPLGRMAEPEDLVGPLLFLASSDSEYVTGQELLVDGGLGA
jgi:NAD(P)-dependent dehydrogenase (short-subunit alcohol dehydrogenase family)